MPIASVSSGIQKYEKFGTELNTEKRSMDKKEERKRHEERNISLEIKATVA
jgi:hypothetical protein